MQPFQVSMNYIIVTYNKGIQANKQKGGKCLHFDFYNNLCKQEEEIKVESE